MLTVDIFAQGFREFFVPEGAKILSERRINDLVHEVVIERGGFVSIIEVSVNLLLKIPEIKVVKHFTNENFEDIVHAYIEKVRAII
ncbi:MAG: hypothetical protein ACFFD4_08035 [Candidatus Odinarchaeota archaeon]